MTELVLAVFDAASAFRRHSARWQHRSALGDRGRGRDACARRYGDLEPIWPAQTRRARRPKPPALRMPISI